MGSRMAFQTVRSVQPKVDVETASKKRIREVIKAGFGTAEVEAGANTGQGPLPHPREY